MKLHVNWGHASANQLKRALVDADGGHAHLANNVDEVSGQCEVCRTFDKAPHVPIADTSTASMFNEKAQVDLPSVDGIVVLRAVDMRPTFSPLLPVQSEYPQEV